MNEQELLEKYLKYIRKRRIIIFTILLVIVFVGIILLGMYFNNANQVTERYIQEENISNEITDNTVDNNSQTVSETTNEIKQEEQITKKVNEVKQEKQNTETTKPQKEIKNTEKVVETSQPTTPTTSTKQESNTSKSKPSNKDFLFTDGYNMDNVSQAAQDYLKSSGHAGECIPLKDNEGVYVGMRVIFY